jgi:hypothetical protein
LPIPRVHQELGELPQRALISADRRRREPFPQGEIIDPEYLRHRSDSPPRDLAKDSGRAVAHADMPTVAPPTDTSLSQHATRITTTPSVTATTTPHIDVFKAEDNTSPDMIYSAHLRRFRLGIEFVGKRGCLPNGPRPRYTWRYRMLIQTATDTQVSPIMLLPELIERMIEQRQAFQIKKFRTTFTDCVPNF